jgi:DNA-directed RNA polymerase specialized sigma subunit
VPYPLDNALFQWEEGARRLRELSRSPRSARSATRAIEAIRDELRRRIGPTFTAQELAELYGRGTDWALEAARHAAPMEAVDLDTEAIVDGAFWLYLRGARDYSGGRVAAED